MYIYYVIPLTYIQQHQYLSYFSSKKIDTGQLVEIRIGHRLCVAIVIKRDDIKQQKQTVKGSSYKLNKIESILTDKRVISVEILSLVERVALHYYESTGLTLQKALPNAFSKPTKPFLKELEKIDLNQPRNVKKNKPVLYITNKNPKPSTGLYLSPNFKKIYTNKQERQLWSNIDSEPVRGNKSFVFFPIYNGGITIEQENNPLYVGQEQRPRIDARFVARIRNKYSNTPLNFYDTIPSLETFYQARENKWKIVKEKYHLAPIHIIDMKKQTKDQSEFYLSEEIISALKKTNYSDKVAIFIHRTGLYSALFCKECTYIPYCSNCSRPLIQHKNYLLCHICSQKQDLHIKCTNCSSSNIKQLGGGTELVEKLVKKITPHLTTARLDYDSAPTLKKKQEVIDSYANNKINVIIGSSMITAEPKLSQFSWSAIALLDTIINLPIHNAQEQAFSIIWRFRTKTKNKVFLQTYLPQLPIFMYAKQKTFEPFLQSQLTIKKSLYLPPFCQIIQITYSGKNENKVSKEAYRVATNIKKFIEKYKIKNTQVLGPSPSYVKQQKGLYKWYIIIKYPRDTFGFTKDIKIRNTILRKLPKGWDVQIDPINI